MLTAFYVINLKTDVILYSVKRLYVEMAMVKVRFHEGKCLKGS